VTVAWARVTGHVIAIRMHIIIMLTFLRHIFITAVSVVVRPSSSEIAAPKEFNEWIES